MSDAKMLINKIAALSAQCDTIFSSKGERDDACHAAARHLATRFMQSDMRTTVRDLIEWHLDEGTALDSGAVY